MQTTPLPKPSLPSQMIRRVTLSHHSEQPDLAALIQWLASWIQKSGAIHGFHNHSVWGGNPYRWGDFTAGHSTFSALMLPLLARLETHGTEHAGEWLERMLEFQLDARQPNGEFEHIGFQVGESLRAGLIHNMVPCVALLLALKEFTPDRHHRFQTRIVSVVEAVLDACRIYGESVSQQSCANQEYARQWVRLLLAEAADRPELRELALRDLAALGEMGLVPHLPDAESLGSLRTAIDPNVIEPAEYYGLMIEPLLIAHQTTGNSLWLEQAMGIARHVVRSSWIDPAGQRRFHRLYHRIPDGTFTRINEPMLIAGMGLTLEGIRKCSVQTGDLELAGFMEQCHRTFAYYQHPGGFFLSATGWRNEADLAPCTAWHSQDAWHLLQSRETLPEKISLKAPTGAEPLWVLLGDTCFYAECGAHWRIGDYLTQDVFALLGRKDEVHFGRDLTWVGGPRALPESYRFPYAISILKTDENLICLEPLPEGCQLMNATSLPLQIANG